MKINFFPWVCAPCLVAGVFLSNVVFANESHLRSEIEIIDQELWSCLTDPNCVNSQTVPEILYSVIAKVRALERVLEDSHPILDDAIASLRNRFSYLNSNDLRLLQRAFESYLRHTVPGADLAWENEKFGREFLTFRRVVLSIAMGAESRDRRSIQDLVIELNVVSKYSDNLAIKETLGVVAEYLNQGASSSHDLQQKLRDVLDIMRIVTFALDSQKWDCKQSLRIEHLGSKSKVKPKISSIKRLAKPS